MTDLTLIQRIQIAGGIARVLANHPGDVSTLIADAKKAMGLAAEIHGVIDGVTAQSAPKPPAAAVQAVRDQNVTLPPSDPSTHVTEVSPPRGARRLSAPDAIEHIEEHGLTPAEQAIFDRASQSSG